MSCTSLVGDFILCKLKNKSNKKYGRVDANHHVALLDEMISMSLYDVHKPSHLVYDKYQDASVTTTTSDLAGDGSDLSFSNSPTENQLLSRTSTIITHEIDESDNLMSSDYEYQNLNNQDGISASVEGEVSPFTAVPSTDFGMQNQNENFDISSLDGLMTCDLESKDEPEINSELSAALHAILDSMLHDEEIENSSLWMPTWPHQSPSWLLSPLEQDFVECLLPQQS